MSFFNKIESREGDKEDKAKTKMKKMEEKAFSRNEEK